MNHGGSQSRRDSLGHDIGPSEDRGYNAQRQEYVPVSVISDFRENEEGEMEFEYTQEHVLRDHNGIFHEPLDETPMTPALPGSGSSNRLYNELERLKTFRDWRPDFPVLPTDLAREGFYYIGPGDKVKCVFCLNILRSWEEGDSVEEEHRKHYPNCPFVLGQCDEKNIPADPHDRSSLERKRRTMGLKLREPTEDKSGRLRTFQNGWPSSCPVNPDSLAEAGFYYIGEKDAVKCFKCKTLIGSWESGDDPWTEHAKISPDCPYVHSVKGANFIKQVRAGEEDVHYNHQNIPQQKMKGSVQPSDAAGEEISGARGGKVSRAVQVSDAQLEQDMKSAVVKAVKEVLSDLNIEDLRQRIRDIRLNKGPSHKLTAEELMGSLIKD